MNGWKSVLSEKFLSVVCNDFNFYYFFDEFSYDNYMFLEIDLTNLSKREAVRKILFSSDSAPTYSKYFRLDSNATFFNLFSYQLRVWNKRWFTAQLIDGQNIFDPFK